MENVYQNLAYKPAPNTSGARRKTDWGKLSNDNLKFALDLLSLHNSPYEIEVANEISKRIDAGEWMDIENSVPVNSSEVPAWLKVFPFTLLWRQGRL